MPNQVLIWKQISGRKKSNTLFNFTWAFGHLCNYVAWNKVLAVHDTKAAKLYVRPQSSHHQVS
ncbi:hypothetical protein PVAP13_7KG141700 [Panicum virgatum]|uniref:Uncharacterized protein n=1 Tax=Panicum virgatum TaxID=38727 RepID=A0A8T0QHJ9_PANVG|nr:hypothetical protein PVAP13_7KG141700 [Panicum virgatum]